MQQHVKSLKNSEQMFVYHFLPKNEMFVLREMVVVLFPSGWKWTDFYGANQFGFYLFSLSFYFCAEFNLVLKYIYCLFTYLLMTDKVAVNNFVLSH